MVRPLNDSEATEGGMSEEELSPELLEAAQINQTDPNTGAQQSELPPSAPTQGSLSVVLVATEDIPEGAEVTISYTGASGATNRRLMVQYGFVIPENQHDRLDFELFSGYVGTTPLRGAPCAAPSAQNAGHCGHI
jgi:hypothetical protein